LGSIRLGTAGVARAREMLYVGFSRARDLLVICGDIDMIRRIAGDAVAYGSPKPECDSFPTPADGLPPRQSAHLDQLTGTA